MTAMRGRVLIVAGSDSGGGAGIQADIKTVTALGGYAMTAITALTAQDTITVHGIHEVPPDFIRSQMRTALADLGADCIKTGMLHRQSVLDAVADVLEQSASEIPLVVDPVMVAKGGARLLDTDTMATLKARLILLATVLTPNLPEAEALTGLEIRDLDGMKQAAEMLLTMGPRAVLVKGGHMPTDTVYDVLVTTEGMTVMEHPRVESSNTHGTGCTLASATATGIAQGLGLRDAVARARAYVAEAIRSAPGYGRGHGPLNHAHTVAPFEA
jgi:hydroxymethylpyrimidine/phosphomethylpyrimidine kinase